MNQSRLRKSSAVGETGRPRLLKVSGDAGKNMSRDLSKETKEHQKNHHHNHNKTSIPKHIRYNLESALVGLCDVWFEDIKPYLLRNNIKLHVPCDGGACAGAGEAAAGGDRGRLPGGARGCSHVDPGAATDRQRRRTVNSAGFCSAPPATSRTRLLRPPQRPCKVPCRRPSVTTLTENRQNSDEGVLLRNHAGCPSVVPFKLPLEAPYTMTQLSYFSSPSPHSDKVSSPQNTPETKDQSTQTEIRRTRSRSPKRLRAKSRVKRVKSQQSPSPRRRQSSPIRQQRSPTTGQKSSLMEMHQLPSRKLRTNSSSSVQRTISRTLVATSPVRRQKSPTKKSVNSVSRTLIEYYRDEPHCQDELDNILGVTFDPNVKYATPKTEKNPATLKLKPSSPKKERVKIKPPWR